MRLLIYTLILFISFISLPHPIDSGEVKKHKLSEYNDKDIRDTKLKYSRRDIGNRELDNYKDSKIIKKRKFYSGEAENSISIDENGRNEVCNKRSCIHKGRKVGLSERNGENSVKLKKFIKNYDDDNSSQSKLKLVRRNKNRLSKKNENKSEEDDYRAPTRNEFSKKQKITPKIPSSEEDDEDSIEDDSNAKTGRGRIHNIKYDESEQNSDDEHINSDVVNDEEDEESEEEQLKNKKRVYHVKKYAHEKNKKRANDGTNKMLRIKKETNGKDHKKRFRNSEDDNASSEECATKRPHLAYDEGDEED